jgi:hypothetical protein
MSNGVLNSFSARAITSHTAHPRDSMPRNNKHTLLPHWPLMLARTTVLLSIVGILCPSIAHGQSAQELLSRADSVLNENNYPLALEKYLIALQVAETEGEHLAIALAQKNVAVCFYYMRDSQSALKWYYRYLNAMKRMVWIHSLPMPVIW